MNVMKLVSVFALTAVRVHAQLVSYEPSFGVFPDESPVDPWMRDGTFDKGWPVDRWIVNDRFVIHAEIISEEFEYGEVDAYRRSVADYVGVERFFVEWVVMADAPNESLPGAAPAVVTASSNACVQYHVTISHDRIRFIRDVNQLPILYFDVAPDVPHRYRLDISNGDWYELSIDGVTVDAGLPECPYPVPSAVVVWGCGYYLHEATCEFQFVRSGELPVESSQDFDTDGVVNLADYFLFHQYQTAPGVNHHRGWSCGDAESDGDIDLSDFASMQNLFTGL
jgi:hypothetical protein